jgi:hypothetical protein
MNRQARNIIRVDQVDDRVVACVEWGDPLAAVLAVGLQQKKPGIQEARTVRVADRCQFGDVVVAQLRKPAIGAGSEPLGHRGRQIVPKPALRVGDQAGTVRAIGRDIEQLQRCLVPRHGSTLPMRRLLCRRVSDLIGVCLNVGERRGDVVHVHPQIEPEPTGKR